VTVEKVLDELWIGVKGQSNLVISCSLRNNFRVSLCIEVSRGRALNLRGGLTDLPKGIKLRILDAAQGDRQRGISFVVKRGTAQIVD
jgi:hypothetical protein